VARLRHPNKEIEAAIRHAESRGWRIHVGGGHAWGRLFCPYNDAGCRCGRDCIRSIWSTPKKPMRHVQELERVVDHCIHEQARKP
jgi:hypothetical protein